MHYFPKSCVNFYDLVRKSTSSVVEIKHIFLHSYYDNLSRGIIIVIIEVDMCTRANVWKILSMAVDSKRTVLLLFMRALGAHECYGIEIE